MKPVVSAQAAKAISLLRKHYVFTVRPVATGFWNSYRIPAFVYDYGIFNTRTGARVMGFGKQTFKELKGKKLLSKPAKFYVLRHHSADCVYTLSPKAVELIVLVAVVQVVKETFNEPS